MGETFEDACVKFILSKSTNNTILNGIENFVKETGYEDYARYIGFIVGELYWDKVARKEPWSEILKHEQKIN